MLLNCDWRLCMWCCKPLASPALSHCCVCKYLPPQAGLFRYASSLWCRKLNKLGTFSLSQIGKSKSPIAEFMRNQRKNNDNFEESLLKLVRHWHLL